MYLGFYSIPVILLLFFTSSIKTETNIEEENDTARYIIEGRAFPIAETQNKPNWQATTRIHVNGGEYIGFIKKDGSFTIHNVPAGSYIVEVLHPEYTFEPARVEINSKGKFRARKVNHIKTSEVIVVPYPLRMKALGKTRYFQVREQWRVTDLLFNPMIMMMVLPLLLIMVLPKMMNDPETKKEMEQIQNMAKFEMSDFVSNYLAKSSSSQTDKDKVPAAIKKNQKARKRIEK
ncbi:ER membrane protein complex subunit 7 [Diorhabda sublineata]|uniref:ER membrane protein complex subunit 7 n=1 Tax=Diorhabda sublineata TaxID=1163346 RepID=UPI0024E11FF9|nr:ER membrane protein complex subunit 7 [Diorhabda sublineata]